MARKGLVKARKKVAFPCRPSTDLKSDFTATIIIANILMYHDISNKFLPTLPTTLFLRPGRGRGRGGGVFNKCLYGEAPPRGPTPYPFIYHFSRKRCPCHIPCLELCISFNWCNALSRKSDNVFSTLQSHKIHLLVRLGPFTDANDRFPYHFLYFN